MVEDGRNYRQGASDVREDSWPDGVYSISIDGLGNLGVHEETGQLFWRGGEIVTKRIITLRWYELLLATAAAVGTFGVFALEVGKLRCWW